MRAELAAALQRSAELEERSAAPERPDSGFALVRSLFGAPAEPRTRQLPRVEGGRSEERARVTRSRCVAGLASRKSAQTCLAGLKRLLSGISVWNPQITRTRRLPLDHFFVFRPPPGVRSRASTDPNVARALTEEEQKAAAPLLIKAGHP